MFGKVRMIIPGGATRLSSSNRTTRLPSTFVSTDITSFACGSNIQHRGKSSASSASSDIPEAKKGRKNVSKAERRAMVESFVNKYRAMNGGKFPSVTDTRKQVGGGFYLLRQIVQELEYKSKLSPLTSESENLPGKQPTQENQSEVGDLSGSRVTVSSEILNDSEILSSNEIESGSDSIQNVKVVQSSASAEKSLPNDIVRSLIEGGHSGFLTTKNEVLGGDAKTVSNPILGKADYVKKVEARGDSVFVAPEDVDKKVEARGDPGFAAPEVKIHEGKTEEFTPLAKRDNSKLEETTEPLAKREDANSKLEETTVSEVLVDVQGTKSKDVPEPKQSSMDNCRRQGDAELAKKPSLWGNLKSFADSIISIWRN